MQHCHQKCTISLRIFGKKAKFYSAYFLTTISLPQHCCWKREVWLHLFAKDAQKGQKMYSYKDNNKFHSVFLATALSLTPRFQQKGEVMEDFEYLRIWKDFYKMLAVLCFVSLNDWKVRTRLKTDRENLAHVYL